MLRHPVLTLPSYPTRRSSDLPGVPCATVYLAQHRLERVDARESRSLDALRAAPVLALAAVGEPEAFRAQLEQPGARATLDRKSTRLNSSHLGSSYRLFCLKQK